MRVALNGDVSGIMSSEALFSVYLRSRVELNPVRPGNAVPNYSADTLSDEQVRDISAYIRSIDDDPPEVADSPVMQEVPGAARARE